MIEKFVSEQLLSQMPLPLLNFLWYLWDVYCDPNSAESILLLQPGEGCQRVTIPMAGKTVEQDFGTYIDATILIRKDGTKYYMSRQ